MTRHRFDPFSFLVGAVAVAVAAVVLVGDVSVRLVDLRIVGPVVVLAIGAALLLSGKRDDRPVVVPSSDRDEAGLDAQPADPADPDHHAEADVPDVPAEPEAPGTTDTLRIDRE